MNLPAWMETIIPVLPLLWRASCQAAVLVALVLGAQWLLRHHLAPRWRHALWWLVVIRLLLPWPPQSPFSLFNWLPFGTTVPSTQSAQAATAATPSMEPAQTAAAPPADPSHLPDLREILFVVWLVGAAGLAGYLLVNTWRLERRITAKRPLTDGSVLDLLEDCKEAMAVRTPLTVVQTAAVASPALFGFIRPRLLLPLELTRSFSAAELRHVFLHELAHVKRGDIALNWLTTLLLVLHWFNPVVWLAFYRMRVDGELACDALALRQAEEARSYGQTIIKLLEKFSRPAVAPGLVGILENRTHMKTRIHMIASFKEKNRWPVAAVAVFAVLGLFTLTDAQPRPGAAAPNARAAAATSAEAQTGAPRDPKAPPAIVSTSPRVGATDVDPGTTEITVTFDRDMAGGFSWTGGGPEYPSGPEGQKPRWQDKRTCVLPVKLERGRFYRVGINSTSYQNFRSAEGVPARPSAIYFTTTGASEELKRRVQKPQVVKLDPLNGATNVDPSVSELRITFNVPMGGGFSWTGGGSEFPGSPAGKRAYWTEDRKTCVLPVELKPGQSYRLGLNSPSHKNFQSAGGVPLDPVSYTFRTKP